MFGASEEIHVEHLQNNAMNVVETICSVVAQPVEMILRIGFGTRFYPPAVTFFAAGLMLFLPAMGAFLSNFSQMIPFVHIPPPVGMFGMDSVARLYFMVAAVHAVRLGRRMLNFSLEKHSEFEGPAWFFFGFLPRGTKFYFTRIVWEPALVLLASIVLQDLFIIQSTVSLYLKCVALCLLTRGFISWFRAWENIRKLIDVRIAGPIIVKLANNEATEEELAPIGLAGFPKSLDPEIRAAAVAQIQHRFSTEN
jgi:hypothetical protein